ncbi:MAG TPA: LCP family protein [Jatrophihabitans sp.]|nr:LCP family protein [Jatrophihabitans sp.]
MGTGPDAPSSGRHRQGRPRRNAAPFVRFSGRLLGALVSTALFLASGWAWYNFAALKRNTHVIDIAGLGQPAPSGVRQAKTGIAQNILIVGIDSRAGLTEAEKQYLKVGNDTSTSTDTIMLVHVPADGSKATLISIPRDSWVHIPGYQDGKINSAYADGYWQSGAHGAAAQERAAAGTLVATVKQLTGVPIDHYVEVGFQGFVDIVKAIGNIAINLCESVDDTHAYNVAHNESGGSGFKMSAGHHDLTPLQALEFVRQRHNIPGPISDDLGRELRQRYFLSAAFKRVLSAGTLLNPFNLQHLVKAIDGAFTFDNKNFDITKFAEQMINLTAGNIVGRSIPTAGNITMDGQAALQVNPAAVRALVQQAFYGTPATTPHPSPSNSSTGSHRSQSASNSAGLSSPAKQGCVY